ncbi:hypothetical protein EDB84DRAFT_112933 [Lactarius hengduanensis]|nr:hypothetical protein EDB84DRAFT_112933 [Lactarius hengduanensis]
MQLDPRLAIDLSDHHGALKFKIFGVSSASMHIGVLSFAADLKVLITNYNQRRNNWKKYITLYSAILPFSIIHCFFFFFFFFFFENQLIIQL